MATKRKADCSPEEWATVQAKQRAYRASESGRAAQKRNTLTYRATENGRLKNREAERRYKRSEKGKLTVKRYWDKVRKLRGQTITLLPSENLRRNLNQDETYAMVSALVSTKLPSFLRDDIISEVILFLLAGGEGDIKQAVRKASLSLYPRDLSLDELHPETGRAWIDTVTADMSFTAYL